MSALAVLALLLASSAGAQDEEHIARWLDDRSVRPVPSDGAVASYLTRRSYRENLERQAAERAGLAAAQRQPPTPPRGEAPLIAEPGFSPAPLAADPSAPLLLVPPRVTRNQGESDDAFIARVRTQAEAVGARAARETLERSGLQRVTPGQRQRTERSMRGQLGVFQRLAGPSGDDSDAQGSKAGAGESGGTYAAASLGPVPALSGVVGMSMADMQAAQAGGLGQPFRDMGLRVGAGPGGRAAVLRADGAPASANEVGELRKRLAGEPLAQVQRPDFHQVIARDKFQELRSHYATKPELRGTTFKDVAATSEVRDFQWSRTCNGLDGGCNPNAAQGAYAKGRYVAPEDLKNMSLDAAKRLVTGSESLEPTGDGSGRKPTVERRSAKSRLGALLEALSDALGAGGGEAERASEWEQSVGLERRVSDLASARRMPQAQPLSGGGGPSRWAVLAAFVTGLATLLGVFVRRRFVRKSRS